jgi:Gpi18-like mannosyltransferase
LTGPAVGEPDHGWAARSRTESEDGTVGVLILLAAGLAFRIIIAYLLPNSGFGVDIQSFRFWAENLASNGIAGFYARDFFHDYTPGYLYVLWAVGKVGQLLGGPVGDLIKVPPILADLALGWVVWSMAKELGASSRAARIGAVLVVFNPVSILDSAIWGQVDSFGVVFLLLALRELWRDRPERSAVLTVLAALIKPQLGILIPIVAAVVIRRALRPAGAYGEEPPPSADSATRWERNVRGPIRILTTGLAGLGTALVLSIPFGLSLVGLVQQIFKTAGGYPFLSVNAYNPWALINQNGSGVAANRQWVCDSTVVATGPVSIKIGDFVLWSAPANNFTCPNGFMIGAFPAVLVGALLFAVAATIVVLLVARRPDRRTMLVGLAVLAIAFFVLPTRVHERYLYPLVGIGAILAAISVRWRIAYVLSAAATFANMYAVLTTLYPNNPGIRDWLGIGHVLTSFAGVAAAAVVQVVVLAWAFAQLRDDRLDELAEEIDRGVIDARKIGPGAGPPLTRPAPPPPIPGGTLAGASAFESAAPAAAPVLVLGEATMPVWEDRSDAVVGPLEWFRDRFASRPTRADRSRSLDREGGGRLDRLDLWLLAVLVVTLLSVRMWRLSEPYGMHFDEVYHARTATEFLQDWRYGISHYIYEWTHPHLAKYAMAVGIEAWGGDSTDATSDLGVPVTDAAIEPRWDPAHDYAVTGDRLWVATGSEVRAYDLSTRQLAGSIELPGATSLAVDGRNHRVFVGLQTGDIKTIDTRPLDDARAAGTLGAPEATAFLTLDAAIQDLLVTSDGNALAATLPATALSSTVVVIDPNAASEVHRTTLQEVSQVADIPGGNRIAVADASGVVFLDDSTGEVQTTVQLDGPGRGVAPSSDISDNPLYVAYQDPTGPRMATITGTAIGKTPAKAETFKLPGDTAGWVFYDDASRMVHVLGSVQDDPAKTPTVYVIEPHANVVYADATLPTQPAAIVMDDAESYPSSDREQLLSLSGAGQVASVEIGDHALAWRIPGVLAGVAMGALLYILARLLFRRRWIAVVAAFLTVADGMLFAQSRIGMNDSYVGLGIVAAYTLFAWLWLRPGDTRRQWIAFWIGMPIVGGLLGLALASKWVAAYAIGGLGILVLSRSALGRLLLIAGLIFLTTVLGYLAISVPVGQTGGNYLFLAIMIGLTLVAVVANVLHPIAWTKEEERFAIGAPIVGGIAILLFGLVRQAPDVNLTLGPLSASPIELGSLAFVGGAGVFVVFATLGRLGLGPRARPATMADTELLDPPAPAPRGWLRFGSAFGLPVVWLGLSLLVIPVAVYVVSYIPWAMVEQHQIVAGWPPGHDGQTLAQLTGDMYRYHNTLSVPHPASSPWWAWPFDFKPVWFYEQGFAGGTSASIYDAGNLVAWWLSIPAMGFVAWQAFKRRSAALALLAIGFAAQWLSWSRIDRAAFQYHYYTSLPFILIGLAYFLAELWHGASQRTWLLARIAGGVGILAPFGLWLLHRPLCAFVRVNDVYTGGNSPACPTLIPDLTLTPRALAIAIVVGVGVLLLVRALLTLEEDDGTGPGLLSRLRVAGLIAVGTSVAFLAVSTFFANTGLIHLTSLPVEPIALVVTLALLPVAAVVMTARDAHRFVIGALGAVGFWFVFWYPNIAALPLPSAIHNAYQGLLPTYLYPFQFPVSTIDRNVAGPNLLDVRVGALLLALVVVAIVVGYSAWTWRIALAERRREEAEWAAGAEAG